MGKNITSKEGDTFSVETSGEHVFLEMVGTDLEMTFDKADFLDAIGDKKRLPSVGEFRFMR